MSFFEKKHAFFEHTRWFVSLRRRACTNNGPDLENAAMTPSDGFMEPALFHSAAEFSTTCTPVLHISRMQVVDTWVAVAVCSPLYFP
jgi:hypothetical protein